MGAPYNKTVKRPQASQQSMESRPRVPIRGVRLRFRTMARKMGVEGRFRTDFIRGGRMPTLWAITTLAATAVALRALPNVFEDHPVRVELRELKEA